LWLQEVTSTFFIYAIFTGTAVATRRNDHLYLTAIADTLAGTARTVVEIATRVVVLGVALCFIYFGSLNFLRGFSSFRMPSMTPIASLYAAIPICGVLVALFTIEQLVNGLRNGFAGDEPLEPPHVASIEDIASAPGGRR
jgi:TRAP-type C4-dicarboxylate transport system permease small subunit